MLWYKIRHVTFVQFLFSTLLLIGSNANAQSDNDKIYLGQNAPGNTPEIFAPNLISKTDRYEFGCDFSKDGKEFFFGVENEKRAEIYYTKLNNGVWSTPEKLFATATFSSNDPMLSPDENRLYFISNKRVNDSIEKNDIDIWYVERNDEGWSSPINAGSTINSDKNEYYSSFTENGTLYFSSNINADEGEEYNFDIYSAAMVNDEYSTPIKLPPAINTNRYEADVFIAADESYIIFCARRREGYGNGDLYISFKDNKGNWTPSVNMGDTINTEYHELCPVVTKDGNYFFFTSNKDLYWVSSSILETFRK